MLNERLIRQIFVQSILCLESSHAKMSFNNAPALGTRFPIQYRVFNSLALISVCRNYLSTLSKVVDSPIFMSLSSLLAPKDLEMAELPKQPEPISDVESGALSKRGVKLSESGATLDKFKEILGNPYDPETNRNGIINIGTAENVGVGSTWCSA